MIISRINSVQMAKNYVKTKTNRNSNNSHSTPNSSNSMKNLCISQKPSFGLDPFVTGGIFAIVVASIVDRYRDQKKINELKENPNQSNVQQKDSKAEIDEVSKRLNISKKEAKEFINSRNTTLEDSNKK